MSPVLNIAFLAFTTASALLNPCELDIQHVVTLGDVEGPGMVGPTLHLTRDSRGLYYTTGGVFPGTIQVFNSDGTYSHSLGRSGQGPGEFRGISYLHIGPADTLFVVDNRNRRLTALTLEGDYARGAPIPMGAFPGGAVVLPNGELLLNGAFATRERAGLPLHIADSLGKVIRSFGAIEPYFDARDILGLQRAMTLAGPDTVWTATTADYTLEAWQLSDGTRVRGLAREPEWWVKDRHNAMLSPNRPPPSRVVDLRFYRDRQLLVALATRAGERWREGLELRKELEGEFWLPARWGAVYNTMIEIVHPSTGEVLNSRRIPHYIRGFVTDDLIFSYREDGNGFPFLDVWRLNLQSCSS